MTVGGGGVGEVHDVPWAQNDLSWALHTIILDKTKKKKNLKQNNFQPIAILFSHLILYYILRPIGCNWLYINDIFLIQIG